MYIFFKLYYTAKICHSWSGNLVSIANWSEFYLNEGLTVFLESKISDRLFGTPASEFQVYCRSKALKKAIDLYGINHEFTKLRPCLRDGVDPDDAFSSVPYDKGYAFVRFLEGECGGDKHFMPFLKKYFDTYAFQSIATDHLRELYEKEFPSVIIDWNAWTTLPGFPLVPPLFDTSLSGDCIKWGGLILNSVSTSSSSSVLSVIEELALSTSEWNDMQRIAFFEIISERNEGSPIFSKEVVERIGMAMRLIKDSNPIHCARPLSLNKELVHRWFMFVNIQWSLSPATAYSNHLSSLQEFLASVGRLKFTRSLYRSWASAQPIESKEFFIRHAHNYHPVTRKMLSRDFGM